WNAERATEQRAELAVAGGGDGTAGCAQGASLAGRLSGRGHGMQSISDFSLPNARERAIGPLARGGSGARVSGPTPRSQADARKVALAQPKAKGMGMADRKKKSAAKPAKKKPVVAKAKLTAKPV